jgi:hypothetical protein
MAAFMATCILVFWSICIGLVSAKDIYISANGSDALGCGSESNPCKSLSYIINKKIVTNGTSILLLSEVSLEDAAVFKTFSDITITSSSPTAADIICNCTGSAKYDQSCGIAFVNCQNVTLMNLNVIGCSMNYSIHDGINYRSALLVNESVNLLVESVGVRQSIGSGLLLLNNAGNITIVKSIFSNNMHPANDHAYGGAGLYISIILCDFINETCTLYQTIPTKYIINSSKFTNNTLKLPNNMLYWPLSYGSGLGILLYWGAYNNIYQIYNSIFTDNKAPCGGGFSFHSQGTSYGNVLKMKNCLIANNSETNHFLGGAGAALGIAYNKYHIPSNNNIDIVNTVFSHNKGYYGSGTLVYVTGYDSSNDELMNYITFNNCTWENNEGVVSSAIEVEPEFKSQYMNTFSVKVTFENCIIKQNRNVENYIYPNTIRKEIATFLIIKVTVHFKGLNEFEDNSGSALYIVDGRVKFINNSRTLFNGNHGYMGGAITLIGFSNIEYGMNSTFDFVNNSASYVGGAIYVISINPHAFVTSHSCFLKFSEDSFENLTFNASFNFENNTSETGLANSIYLSTIMPCNHACYKYHLHSLPLNRTFSNSNCLGNFHFSESSFNQIASDSAEFLVSESTPAPLSITPGRLFTLPITVLDEMGNNITSITVYQVKVHVLNGDITIANGFSFVTNNIIELRGKPGSIGNLTISISAFYGAGANVQVMLSECPPGYVLDDTTQQCVCSTSLSNDKYHYNYGIVGCNASNHSALAIAGYWVGYILNDATNDTPSQDNLYTAHCPIGFCRYSEYNYYNLTLVPDVKKLEAIVCTDNREGKLCSQCSHDNNSVYFHSNTFKCASNELCHFGVIFYFLSEILPITIFFILILRFNVSLTNGAAYSVIFMVQSLQLMIIYKTMQDHTFFQYFYTLIYDIFNMEFFNIDCLSYCFWEGADSLDMIVIRYVSVLYAIFLIIAFVNIANHCTCCKCFKICRSANYSVLQGLTAFLVICYLKCVQITFMLLNRQTLYGIGSTPHQTVAFWDGEIEYMTGKHLIYAILALLCLFLIIIPLPLILLFDGLILKIEYHITSRYPYYHEIKPWTKLHSFLKPLLDSFHGAFKDNYRFFAGIFFLYRVLIFIIFLITSSTGTAIQYYFLLQVMFVIMIVIQTVFQPFESNIHNKLSLLILSSMAIINAITLRLNILSTSSYQVNYEVDILKGFRDILICLPMIVVCCWIIWLIGKRCYRKVYYKKIDDYENLDNNGGDFDDDFPEELFERSRSID